MRTLRPGILLGLLFGSMFVLACAVPAAADTGTVASADGLEIAYETHGDPANPAVVLSHCWSCDRSYWRRQIQGLAVDRFVVAVDLAGHGDSAAGREEYTIDAYGADVAAVVEKLGLQRVVLVGHSMSGGVVLAAAARLGDRVVGIIGIDTLQSVGFPFTAEMVDGYMDSMRPDFAGATRTRVRAMFHADSDSAVVTEIAEDMASAPPEVAIPSIGGFLLWDPKPALAKITAPIVCIDSRMQPVDGEAWKIHEPGYDVVYMEDIGHFPMAEKPEEFLQVLKETVARFD